MALPDEERQAFVDVATKFVAWREAAELKSQRTGKPTHGDQEALALANQMTGILLHFYRDLKIGAVRFRGTLYSVNAMTGTMTIIPERGIETIEG